MAYKENIGSCIAEFDQCVKKSGLPFDTERKLLSILRSLEYQVEIGVCPVPVALHLKEAMQAWIEASGNKHKSLSTDVNKCVDVVLNEIGGTEQKR
jgi:hypothetical protein